MAKTRTGAFGIGFRRGGSGWQQDVPGLCRWAKENGFEGVDVGPLPVDQIKQIRDAGLAVGSIDLQQPWSSLLSKDAGKRRDAAQANADYIQQVAPLGVKNFFCVCLPEDPAQPRPEIFKQGVDGCGQLCDAIRSVGARVVFEGWPGNPGVLACTTADYRALLAELPVEAAGVNYDPSHLVRMFIDPLRFLEEFAPRTYHVHGKDTQILEDELQEHGNTLPATFARKHGFGGAYWRYTLPGHGVTRWDRVFQTLGQADYQGLVSIELEDENFNGSEAGEKQGLIFSRQFLESF